MGREFSAVHPTTARLLEGFAFLPARIRERVDDAVPAIVHNLAQLLLPHFLRPIPAASILQYMPTLRTLRAAQVIPRGTRVASRPRRGTSCESPTTRGVELLPIELLDASLDETS